MDSERLQPTENDDDAGLVPLLDQAASAGDAVGSDGDRDSDPELDEDGYDDEDEDEDVEDRHEEDDGQERALSTVSYPEAPPADLEALVHYVVAKLVADPETIEISAEQRGGTMYLALRVPETDLGRVIGREGRTAKAIRTLVSIAGSKSNVHARLDIDG